MSRISRMSTPAPLRCAIYTRKSTEHNLDLAFNSLDAQRDACEAYIRSQANEGWTLVPDRYDDGGLSGASLERPALQALLNQVRVGKVDIIVVYKVDRLTRSLADFAKLVELFDEHDASFVSVTQSFNTTTSMGRLTLNVLLSFAQFEREVIGERVRDKIAASKRKGIWVGGPVPLGYRSVNKTLEVVPEHAAFVERIFCLYLEENSLIALAARLDREGIRPPERVLTNGRAVQAGRFMVGPLRHILRNRFYIGEVAYKGEVHKAWHPPVIRKELFDAVQQRLEEQAVGNRVKLAESEALLAGLLFDDAGNAMSPSHTNKRGVRYRYYVSQALLQGEAYKAGSRSRVSAPDIEKLVRDAVVRAVQLDQDISLERDELRARVSKVKVTRKVLEITFAEGSDGAGAPSDPLIVPLPPSRCNLRKGIHRAPDDGRTLDPKSREQILTAIAKARSWMTGISSREIESFEAIAAQENLAIRHVRRLAVLAFLSPDIIRRIAEGTAPIGMTISSLTTSMPLAWSEQARAFAIGT